MNTHQLLTTAQTLLALLAIIRPEATGAAALVQGAMRLLRDTILPGLRAAVQRGEITPEIEAEVRRTYDLLDTGIRTGAAFAGAHWQLSGE